MLTVILLTAGELSVTMQVAEADELRVVGLHDSEDKVGVDVPPMICTVPPVAVIGTDVPLLEAPTGLRT